MHSIAIIDDGIVENCVVVESLEDANTLFPGKTHVEYFLVEPGWTYVDGKFTNPNAQSICK